MQRAVKQAELQQDIERFATRFMQVIWTGATPVAGTDAKAHETAMRQVLAYASSALEIASGPVPEVALLDMIVFVTLSRHALESRSIGEVLGEGGRTLVRAFAEADREVWEIGEKVLTPDEETHVRNLIDDWLRQNPEKVRVESMRFYEFSELAGQHSDRASKDATGLFRSMKLATLTADDAVLLGQRAMFVAHRLPFLIRLQTRLGISEVISDMLLRLEDAKHLAERMPALQPLLDEVIALAHDSKATAKEAQGALHALEPVLERMPPQNELQKTLGAASQLTEKADALLHDVHTSMPANPLEAFATVTRTADHVARRWAVYVALIGVAWSLCFWGGYYAFKRLTLEGRPAPSVLDAKPEHHATRSTE